MLPGRERLIYILDAGDIAGGWHPHNQNCMSESEPRPNEKGVSVKEMSPRLHRQNNQ